MTKKKKLNTAYAELLLAGDGSLAVGVSLVSDKPLLQQALCDMLSVLIRLDRAHKIVGEYLVENSIIERVPFIGKEIEESDLSPEQRPFVFKFLTEEGDRLVSDLELEKLKEAIVEVKDAINFRRRVLSDLFVSFSFIDKSLVD